MSEELYEKFSQALIDGEPEDAEEALFFKNEITIKFPCDSVEREVTDLSVSGLKVFLEDSDPLEEFLDQDLKGILTLKNKSYNVQLHLLYKTEDEFGLTYIGCRFENLSKEHEKVISEYLSVKRED